MKVLRTDATGADVHLSLDELDALRNALNEARLLLSSADFPTRVGISLDEANRLLKDLQALIGEVDGVGSAVSSERPAQVKQTG